MSNQIANEKIKSLQYYLKTDKQGYVEISFENVAKVEAMIAHDSAYTRSFNKTSAPDEKWLEAFDIEAFIEPWTASPTMWQAFLKKGIADLRRFGSAL